MIDKQLIERIHEDLEGKLAPEEQRRLQEQLASDPEAAGYYNDWQQIQKNLEKNKEVAPDINLAQEISRKIPFASASQVKSGPLLHVPFWQRQYVKYSFVLLAGIFIGFLVFALLMPDRMNNYTPKEQMTATLFDSRNFDQMKVAGNLLF